MSDACPQCHLPKEELAWQCDGCGLLFRRDFDALRTELTAKLRTARLAFVVTVVVCVGAVAGVVVMAMHGWIYISVPLALAVIGSIGHAVHRISAVREQLRSLDRRHVPIPAASVHRET